MQPAKIPDVKNLLYSMGYTWEELQFYSSALATQNNESLRDNDLSDTDIHNDDSY
jgi:hypothetical protein